MAKSRARRRGELDDLRVCTVCGKKLKPTSIGAAYEQHLCFEHWALTPEGKEALKQKRAARGSKTKEAKPFRYFGCLPGEEAWPEGPFNRMRLAVSSTYEAKNKPRGTLFIVWSDDTVTAHRNVKQADVGSVEKSAGEEVNRSDLALMARTMDGLTERVRRYGHSDVYLV